MERSGGSLRTRSQAAPVWTLHESVTLVNEMKATQIECGNTLASFQKWQSTVHNCNSLGVNRSLNQCKRRWESMLEQYNKVKPWESAYWDSFDEERKRELDLPEQFDFELFNAIARYLSLEGEDGGGAETDPDTDPEAQQVQGNNAFLEIGPKRQRRRTKTKRYKMEERLNPWRRILNENRKYEQSKMGIKHEASIDANLEAPRHENSSLEIKRETSSPEEMTELPNLSIVSKVKAEQYNVDNPEEMMAATLRENAEMITAIAEGNTMDDRDCMLADLNNFDAGRVHLIRSQGNQLIDCLGKISDTLIQLCDAIHKK
ncbi:trihelix transcription factor ASR3 [Solanum stenotomum]|uniref:trihelix transcription factor ASR3 n=1 Tax=Solanum stenotomum TaxID=172797 RepID=UPI0020D0E870|nr:trihelix transcription factor ASR3 [Solanum stenotomum]